MQKWEYQFVFIEHIKTRDSKVIYPKETKLPKWVDLNNYLNWLGERGWELCGTSSSQSELGTYVDVSMFFKRPKE